LEEMMMTKKIALFLAVGAALGLSLVSADEAQAFGRRNGSHGSAGSYGSNGSFGSGGSFGGLFSRRNRGSYDDCHVESNGSCGSHGGTHIQGSQGEVQSGTTESGSGGPPPAPRDPGAGASNAAPSEANREPVAAADRNTPVTIVSNRRTRFFR
jgi:hypothetical protein